MNKIFLALFLLLSVFFIIIIYKFLLLTFTGLVSESLVRMSVGNTTLGRFVYFSYPGRIDLECGVTQIDNITFDVMFKNVGNFVITERIEIHVKDSFSNTIADYYDDTFDLPIGEIRNFSANWTPSIGSYIVTAYATYNSTLETKTAEESHTFEMTKKEGIGTLQNFPNQIVDTIPPGRTKSYSPGIQLFLYKACNGTNVTLNTTKGIPGEWVSFSNNNTYLTPDNVTIVDINITIPPLIPKGFYYNGSIFAYADGQGREIKLRITVGMTDFILNVTTQEKQICQGGSVNGITNITKVTPSQDVNINLTYQIADYNLIIYDEKKEYNILLGNQPVQKLSTLTVPSSARLGYYIFLTTLDYNSTLTQAYDTFEVISCPTPTEAPTGGGGGGGEIKKSTTPKTIEHKIILNLSTDTLTVIKGNQTSFTASVNNIGKESIKSIKISIEGIPSEWISIFPETTDLAVNETKDYFVYIDIPNETTSGVYKLKVKAIDDEESNTAILTLIIGKDMKEIADLLIKELDGVRAEAKRSLLVKDCINVTTIKTIHHDAELAFEKGMDSYDKKDYESAVNWFEYSLPIEKKVVSMVDIALELEIGSFDKSQKITLALLPPNYKTKEKIQLAQVYLQDKNYEKMCDPVLEMKRLIFLGLIFWPSIGISIIVLIVLILTFIAMKRREEEYKETDLILPSTS